MTRKLEWKPAGEDGVDETETIGFAGIVEIGRVRLSATSGSWRWEIAALPGDKGSRADRRGGTTSQEMAMRVVETEWNDWLKMAGL